jgi:hypothetical protein
LILAIQFSGIASKIVVFFLVGLRFELETRFPFHKHRLALTLPDAPEWFVLYQGIPPNDSTTLSPVKALNGM